MSKIPGLPPVPANVDPATRQWMEAFAEAVAVQTGQRGDPLDRALTVRDVGDAGIASIQTVGRQAVITNNPGTGSEILTDLTPPPPVAGLHFSLTPSGALFRWASSPGQITRGVSIYRAGPYDSQPNPLPSFEESTPIGFSSRESFSDATLAPRRYYYYWFVSVSFAGVEGAAHRLGGTEVLSLATTDQILEEIKDGISEEHLHPDLNTRVDKIEGVESALSQETIDRRDADSALASDISTIQTTVGNHTTFIQELSSVQSGLEGDIASVRAEYTLKLDAGGYVSGFSAINDGSTSSFLFRADTFAVGAPGAANLTFAIQDGAVVFDGASIANGTITGNAFQANSISAQKLIGGSAFLEEVGVDVIYNSGGSESNYRMKIDLVNGFIHIK